MRKLGSSALLVLLLSFTLGQATLATPAAAASSDPCLPSGYARVASGDVGAAGWYPNSHYNVAHDNKSPWSSSNAADHNMQWEMTYAPSSRTAQFCVRNLKAIGRTSLGISTVMIEPNGVRHATPKVPADPVPAGAGWVLLSSSDLPSGGTYRVYFADYWNAGNSYAWLNVKLCSYRAYCDIAS